MGKSGNLPGALEIIDEVISKREETAGENHRDTLLAKHNKASMLFDAGDYSGAYEIQQELLNNHSDFFEQNKPQRLRAKSMMAVIKSNMDSAEMQNEAIAEQEAILAEYTSRYDYETNEMLEAMNFMGMVYSNCGEYKKAHEKLVEALAKYEAFYGAKHPLTRNIARGVVATLLNGIRSGKIVKTPFLKGREARVRRKYGV